MAVSRSRTTSFAGLILLIFVEASSACWLFIPPLIPFEVVDQCRLMVPKVPRAKIEVLALNPLLGAETYEDKCFVACLAEVLKVLDKKGKLVADQIRANGYRTVFVPWSTPTQIQERLSPCSQKQAQNLCETGLGQLKCLADIS